MIRLMLIVCVLSTACAPRSASPVAVRTGEDACAYCRMTIVAISTAAQIVVPGGEPIMFDEIGCLQRYLSGTRIDTSAAIYVADHRTGAWIDATRAVFTRTAIQTPMSSGLLAHADAASRDADRAADGGSAVPTALVIGAAERSGTK